MTCFCCGVRADSNLQDSSRSAAAPADRCATHFAVSNAATGSFPDNKPPFVPRRVVTSFLAARFRRQWRPSTRRARPAADESAPFIDIKHKVRRFMLLMIDNYDSINYNLVQYLAELGEDVRVYRNDQIGVDEVARLKPDHIVISPGPCTPNEAGVSLEVIRHFAGKIPLLGVCLGHQAIGQSFGGKVVRARQVMHGKTSSIHHADKGVFKRLPNPFEATRYHSLIIEQASLPACLEVTAWTENERGERDEIMGVRHREYALEGVQFHPESILTQHGHAMLKNFLATRGCPAGTLDGHACRHPRRNRASRTPLQGNDRGDAHHHTRQRDVRADRRLSHRPAHEGGNGR